MSKVPLDSLQRDFLLVIIITKSGLPRNGLIKSPELLRWRVLREKNTGFEVLLTGTKFPAWPLAGHVTSGPSALLWAVGPVRGVQAFRPGKAHTKQEVSTQSYLPPSAPLSTNICREVTK